MIDAFYPPTADIEYNIRVILEQGFTVSREDLIKAHSTARVHEAIWSLIEAGYCEWTEDYTSIRKKI